MNTQQVSSSFVRHAMSDRVYVLLKSRIINLDLKPGSRVQIERYGRELDVSHTPVREALNRLTAEGLVIAEPYRGFSVAPLLGPAQIQQLLEAREVMEVAAVNRAALGCESGVIDELTGLVQKMDDLASVRHLDVKAFNSADAQFHRKIVEASGNSFLLWAFESLHAHVRISRHFQGRSSDEAQRSNSEHQSLVEAIMRKDGIEAVTLVKAHLNSVLRRLKNDYPVEHEVIVK